MTLQRLIGFLVALTCFLSNPDRAVADDIWRIGALRDADKILECSAILDLFDVPNDTEETWPDGTFVDFPVAAKAMRDRVALLHGTEFTERRYRVHREYWEMATPQDPKVADLEAFLASCRAFGTTHGLPM